MQDEGLVEILIIFGLIVLINVVLIAALIYGYRRNRRLSDLVASLETAWRRAGRTIRFAPVRVEYFTNEPRRNQTYAGAKYGALGVVDAELVFQVPGGVPYCIPLASARWIGAVKVSVQRGKTYQYLPALIVHYQDTAQRQVPQWRRAVFLPKAADLPLLGDVLSEVTGLPFHDRGREREDYGPARAARLVQDVHGLWHGVRDDGMMLDPRARDPHDLDLNRSPFLYLAPDRLIVNWRTEIPLAAVRGVSVYPQGALASINPFSQDLLRVEYSGDDGTAHVAGFLLRNGPAWGRAIAGAHGSLDVAIHTGRKQK